jgi:hypothetical protein
MAVSPTFFRRALTALAVVGGLVALPALSAVANDGTPVPPSSVLGPSTAATGDTVALFFDSNYVDTATDGGGEAYNVQQTLLGQGYTVDTFTGVTTADWTTALSGAQVVAVPELEVSGGDLPADLEAGALAALQAFVTSGGRLITFSDRNFEFLEEVLNLPVDSVDDGDGCPCTKTAAAAGTEWGSGPATLGNNDATDPVLVSTLPTGTTSIYTSDSDADASALALIPAGSGSVVYFAWDWFFEEGQDDNWFDVLNLSISGSPAPPPEPPVTPPTTPVTPEPVAAAPRFTG